METQHHGCWWPGDIRHQGISGNDAGPCITNVIATCRKNFSQWERSFLWKLRCHWLKFLWRVAVIQGPVLDLWAYAAFCTLTMQNGWPACLVGSTDFTVAYTHDTSIHWTGRWPSSLLHISDNCFSSSILQDWSCLYGSLCSPKNVWQWYF